MNTAIDSLRNAIIKNINMESSPVRSSIDSLSAKLIETNELIAQNHNLTFSEIERISKPDYGLLLFGALLGALIGLGFSLLYDWRNKNKRRKTINSICSKYEGIYLSYEKYDQEDQPKYFFELTRDENLFQIKDGVAIIGHEDFDAEITMAEPTFQNGRGYYQHKKSLDGATRFGFLEIQLAKDEILVHVTIHKEGKENSDAYRWVKQEYSKKDELKNKYRELQQENLKKKFSN